MSKLSKAAGAIIDEPIKPAQPRVVTKRLLPNWLLTYGEYTADTESSAAFHMWAGMFAIAAVTVRQLYIPRKTGNIYTNLYIGFVGEPATRKSTAINMAFKLAEKVVPQHTLASVVNSASLIASLSDMKDQPTQAGNLISSELGSLLRQNDTDTVSTLTDLYDCYDNLKKRTISRGYETIAKPWLNFLFGTTPQWLGANMPASSAEGGLFSRIIFIHSDEAKLTQPFPEDSPNAIRLRAALINDLIHINSLKGEVTFTQEARDYYSNWYMDIRRLITKDTRTKGYYARKDLHVLKVAMILMLAQRDTLVIEKTDIETALALLAEIEPGINKAVGAVGANEMMTHIQAIAQQIKFTGTSGITITQLIRNNIHNVNRGQLDEVIGSLKSMGEIRQEGLKLFATT
jgi:hypothetical protein